MDFINAKEATALLHVSAETLRRWADEGKIETIRTDGGHRRYLKSDVLQLKNKASVDTNPKASSPKDAIAKASRPEDVSSKDTIVKKLSSEEKPKTTFGEFIASLMALLILVFAFGGFFYWHHTSVAKSNKQNIASERRGAKYELEVSHALAYKILVQRSTKTLGTYPPLGGPMPSALPFVDGQIQAVTLIQMLNTGGGNPDYYSDYSDHYVPYSKNNSTDKVLVSKEGPRSLIMCSYSVAYTSARVRELLDRRAFCLKNNKNEIVARSSAKTIELAREAILTNNQQKLGW